MPTFDASTNPERIPFVDVLMALCDLAQAGGVQIMLVGATARDIALAAEGHDAPLRATNDVDIAVVVADAAAFERLVADLAAVPGGGAHKFRVNGIEVDIVRVGGIEREDRTVIWPDGLPCRRVIGGDQPFIADFARSTRAFGLSDRAERRVCTGAGMKYCTLAS
jgi:predicted nucleotidyltransferase